MEVIHPFLKTMFFWHLLVSFQWKDPLKDQIFFFVAKVNNSFSGPEVLLWTISDVGFPFCHIRTILLSSVVVFCFQNVLWRSPLAWAGWVIQWVGYLPNWMEASSTDCPVLPLGLWCPLDLAIYFKIIVGTLCITRLEINCTNKQSKHLIVK